VRRYPVHRCERNTLCYLLDKIVAKPGNANDVSFKVFEGKLTEMGNAYPSNILAFTAHDKSIDLRRRKQARTFANKDSVAIARFICNEYGYAVDVDLGAIVPQTRPIDHGGDLTDWEHIARSLGADGLEFFMDPKDSTKLVIRQKATRDYATTFQRGSPPIISFSCRIQHIHGPSNPDKQSVLDAEQTGTTRAVTAGGGVREAARAKATERSHRVPVGRQGAAAPWSNQVDLRRRRKDSATLTCTALPDLTLRNTVSLGGFGGKADGRWYIDTIKHDIAKGDGPVQTTLSLHREPSAAAAKSIGSGSSGLAPESTAA